MHLGPYEKIFDVLQAVLAPKLQQRHVIFISRDWVREDLVGTRHCLEACGIATLVRVHKQSLPMIRLNYLAMGCAPCHLQEGVQVNDFPTISELTLLLNR